jgi:hypothetical protein
MGDSMKWYLAGPMSGIPQSNFPAFDEAAKHLRDLGHDIVSPAELDDEETRANSLADLPTKQTWGDFLARDVKIVADQVQGIVFLPGWQKSRGARLEAFVGLQCDHIFALYFPEEDNGLWYVSREYVKRYIVKHTPGDSIKYFEEQA